MRSYCAHRFSCGVRLCHVPYLIPILSPQQTRSLSLASLQIESLLPQSQPGKKPRTFHALICEAISSVKAACSKPSSGTNCPLAAASKYLLGGKKKALAGGMDEAATTPAAAATVPALPRVEAAGGVPKAARDSQHSDICRWGLSICKYTGILVTSRELQVLDLNPPMAALLLGRPFDCEAMMAQTCHGTVSVRGTMLKSYLASERDAKNITLTIDRVDADEAKRPSLSQLQGHTVCVSFKQSKGETERVFEMEIAGVQYPSPRVRASSHPDSCHCPPHPPLPRLYWTIHLPPHSNSPRPSPFASAFKHVSSPSPPHAFFEAGLVEHAPDV